MVEVDFLNNIPLFRGLRPEKLQSLIPQLRQRAYRRGEVIFHQDDPGGHLYIILVGQVRISVVSEDGRERDITLLDSGECFGEVSFLDGGNRSATATAAAPTETLVLARSSFYQFLRENPEAMEHIARLLGQRLRDTDHLLGDLLFLAAPVRVARQLARLVENQGADASDLVISIDQDQLARLVGASRETVNRALRLYESRGVLRTSHRSITITDLEALQEAAASGEWDFRRRSQRGRRNIS